MVRRLIGACVVAEADVCALYWSEVRVDKANDADVDDDDDVDEDDADDVDDVVGDVSGDWVTFGQLDFVERLYVEVFRLPSTLSVTGSAATSRWSGRPRWCC